MADERLFDKLYNAARHREHVRIRTMVSLIEPAGLGMQDIPAAGRLADALLEEHECFESDLLHAARENRMRIRDNRPACPECGDPECAGWQLALGGAIVVGAAIVKKYYGGDHASQE